MFALFFSLYYSMFMGTWYLSTINNILIATSNGANKIGELLTSIFGDNQMLNFGDIMQFTTVNGINYNIFLTLVAFVLALITSIGIVVMAVKGIKRVFSIFFMGIR